MIIDIHGHLSPPEAARRFPMPPSLTDVDGMIADREAAGIDLTIIGSPVGAGAMMRVPGMDNYAQPRDRLRAFHDWMAGVFARFPEQLRGYVYVNPFGDDDHFEGVRETLADPHFVGLIVNSSVQGRFLDSPDADSFFAFADEIGRPVLVHPPAEPAGGAAVTDFRFVEQIVRHADMGTGLAMIAFAGWLEKYPDLKVIGSTGGGAIASLVERLDAAARPRPWGAAGTPPQGSAGPAGPPAGGRPDAPARPAAPGASVRRMYVDTAVSSQAHLKLNAEVLGPEHLLFGTDSPPLPRRLPDLLRAVEQLPLDEDGRRAVLGGNAVRLFGLDRTAATALVSPPTAERSSHV
ncbi:amidohydrolase family protein [Streptomyces sp. NPDC006602]|uniref:amidohydrolase family protein n=1 Tax=Streptomyces sp. NPDC006602 TaxID=3364751 RepID=UPI0036D0B20F